MTLAVALFLVLILGSIAMGVIGVVVQGLLYLLIIGVMVFIIDMVFLGAVLDRKIRGPAR